MPYPDTNTAFAAITLKTLHRYSEAEQHAHEAVQSCAAQLRADRTRGSVKATGEGESTGGRYCREFQHEIRTAGRQENAYGTACRQSNGAWEVVATGR